MVRWVGSWVIYYFCLIPQLLVLIILKWQKQKKVFTIFQQIIFLKKISSIKIHNIRTKKIHISIIGGTVYRINKFIQIKVNVSFFSVAGKYKLIIFTLFNVTFLIWYGRLRVCLVWRFQAPNASFRFQTRFVAIFGCLGNLQNQIHGTRF
jgi:hypothetical protein